MRQQPRRQTTGRRRSNHQRGQPGKQSRRAATRNRQTFGLRLLLIAVLVAFGLWALTRVPSGVLVAVGISLFAVILLVIVVWFVLRYRLTPEEQIRQAEQRMELIQMEETAQVMGVRRVELSDLAHLTHEEFEYLTGTLLEAMGVLFEWERVGGSGDHGIDLRGKNQYGLPMVVQCKHVFSGKVTPDQTRDFGWALGLHSADEAWFVTTASFTKQAMADVGKLTYPGHMKLIDGEKLMGFLWDHWDTLSNKWQWRLTECTVANER